jgi:hypothetical protein
VSRISSCPPKTVTRCWALLYRLDNHGSFQRLNELCKPLDNSNPSLVHSGFFYPMLLLWSKNVFSPIWLNMLSI